MAEIEGFCGLRYSLADGLDISDRLAPPYDTLSTQAEKDALLGRSEHNIVAIDLPYLPPTQAGPEHLYVQAGELLDRWLAEKVLLREVEPALYLYRQVFTHAGKQYVRRGFIGRLKLEEFGTGHVLPHEKTHLGPKEDRLRLAMHTKANISPVFCLYEDAENEITDTLYSKADTAADYHGELNGVKNEVWVVSDRQLRSWLGEQMSDRAVYIADGHHRYSTALMYRDHLAKTGQLRERHPGNYVAAMFVSMSEPGLLILPTHRGVTGLRDFSLDELSEALADEFEQSWRDMPDRPAAIEATVNGIGDQAFAFFNSSEQRYLTVWPKHVESLLSDLADTYSLAWRTLGVSILHSYILDRVIYRNWLAPGLQDATLDYFPRADELAEFVRTRDGSLGVVVPPTPIEAVRGVCTDGDLMPQKSTYFYPKLATGLVINPLTD